MGEDRKGEGFIQNVQGIDPYNIEYCGHLFAYNVLTTQGEVISQVRISWNCVEWSWWVVCMGWVGGV